MKKIISIAEIEKILIEFCKKYDLIYREFYIDKSTKWFIFSYGVKIKTWYGCDNIRYECYSMELDNEYKFTKVKTGLTKQLKGYKISDIENIKLK